MYIYYIYVNKYDILFYFLKLANCKSKACDDIDKIKDFVFIFQSISEDCMKSNNEIVVLQFFGFAIHVICFVVAKAHFVDSIDLQIEIISNMSMQLVYAAVILSFQQVG
ncbi:hypothetical protein RFI_22998 [Reticulomyxa filosa]|uniref:Uncharacterized protein n=1 Tax=Reticulomyxa filosa TaxID=46433 RepID=X6MKM0_RETFI|nr:hypothetical protein RFI_22998 [Reticulomyxa filosa]|eukprot:ETO14369.1 hypothetical protein RFI_22998 [Reticulomyxa filosa]